MDASSPVTFNHVSVMAKKIILSMRNKFMNGNRLIDIAISCEYAACI